MSPESNNATVVGVIIGAISFVAGAIAAVFGSGRKISAFEHSLKRSHERHDEHDRKFIELLDFLKIEKFINKTVCAEERADCHLALSDKFTSVNIRLEKLENKLDEVKESQHKNYENLLTAIHNKK